MTMMTTRLKVKTFIGLSFMVLHMQSWTTAFMTDLSSSSSSQISMTHEGITRAAILQTTAEVCRSQAIQAGRDFVLPHILTEESLTAACSSPGSAKAFKSVVKKVTQKNAWVDVWHVFSAKHHFDDQTFHEGRDLISKGVSTVKANVKQQRYEAAREKLGKVLHTLQDFYSHSNWIEMGNSAPYSSLIQPSNQIDNIADSATCRSCTKNNCTGNILEEIISQKKLTSGYFGLFFSSKPEGRKCSHGGTWDRTSRKEPLGGINKDDEHSVHGYLHPRAAQVAVAATRELLEDIRAVAGDSEFLRLMGFTQTSVLCFVIDTTGSMSNDIAEVRRVTSSIINSKTGTGNQPSEYILVPFNDPDYGPLTRTTDPDEFKSKINELTAHDGGDIPEMCLSGLQLALTGSPPETEIFVFTDADAKDTWLKGTVQALIERTKSVVTFMLTNAPSSRRRRRNYGSQNGHQRFFSRLSNPQNEIYHDLARASGGQAIEVTKATLPQATSIIVDASSSSLVTVFQAVRNPPKAETFSFFVDSSLQNLTIYITGNFPYYSITSPSGVSQTSAEPNGALGLIQMVGNFHAVRVKISDQAGQWFIGIDSAQPYTVKVIGQSGVDFLFDFVELFDGPHPSYSVLNGRPAASKCTYSNVTLLVSMVGGDNVRPTEIALVEASSSNSYNGTLKEIGSGKFMVTINNVPAGEFVVRVVGESSFSKASNGLIQRQSSTQLQASSVTVTTQADGTLEPGRNFILPFTVATNGSGGIFTVRVSNDRSFEAVFNPSLTLERGGSANGTVTLVVPENTPSGSDVTVTVEVEAPGGADSNYAVLRLSVVDPVTDINPPVCEIVSINANCSSNCSLFSWDLSANMTDGNGSGIQSVTIRQGNGTLNTSTALDRGVNITVVFYSASCCFPEMELVMVDAVGNVGSCLRSLTATVDNTTTTAATTSPGRTIQTSTNGAGSHLFLPPGTLTEESLAAACSSFGSAKAFKNSIDTIADNNVAVDVVHFFNPIFHFDNETFLRGRDLITSGLSAVKASVKQQSYEAARQKLGEILHTLQDFYSHSNWIELGNFAPYPNLINPSSPIDNIADSATCSSCDGNNCKGNILEEVLRQKKLTSGYFSLTRFDKPKGKCSHGGFLDLTSYTEPKGGISKDTVDSSHGDRHNDAAYVAIAATRELLEDIRAAVGNFEFLRLMGLTQTSVLCFVNDTTGSMSNDIAEVRRITSLIIDSKKGTEKTPSEYILVPFNDPDFGPLTRTTDPDVFKSKIAALKAKGGGDAPEMCLSGLQLALTGSPPQTEIFVFMDADAKDKWLKSTVLALIQRTKSSVSFLLTNALSARRRRSSDGQQDGQQQFSSRLSNPLNGVYEDLAQASGGQAVEVTKATLPQATSIIVDTASSSLVTVFQAVRNPAKAETFSFFVDSSLQNLTIYITGNSLNYIIISPSGVSQNSAEPSGALGQIKKVGNFNTFRPDVSDQTGQWVIRINSTQPYTVKVLGQSEVDFLFSFIKLFNGPHPSYTVLNSRPAANSNVTLLVSMVGGDSVRPTKVALIDASSSNTFNGVLEEVGSNQFMVTINSVPPGEFVVRVDGESSFSKASSGLFQRQSSTQIQASSVTVTTQADGTLEPGRNFTLPFIVATNGSGGIFTVRVSNDRSFEAVFNSSLTLERGGSANGTVTLAVPENTPSGSDITVTVEAEAPGGADSNYAVLRLSVVAPVTDINPPVCEIVSINANCSSNCSIFSWDLSANMTDGNGSGIQSVTIRQGNGTLNTSTVLDRGVNITVAFYSASCCFPEMELVMVDAVGNVGSCSRFLTATVSPSTKATSTETSEMTKMTETSKTSQTTETNATITAATSSPGRTIQSSTNGAHSHLPMFLPVFFWLTVGISSVSQYMQL
ncbi:hypothetical protein NFI96_022024 [Prochilodus magdalenae]|nr:hypothetical protein NFI96_022024 [Prochilodus magdalenae]